MKNISLACSILFIVSNATNAQFNQHTMDSIKTATNEDYQLILHQLGIDSLRSGPSGNPQAPNAANRDELKA
jgi:hypothetical protein